MANLLIERRDGVATITMNRPEVHNAFDDLLIAELTAAFEEEGSDPANRALVLAAKGPSFSAGADLGWMRRMAGYSEQENLRDAMALAGLMECIDRCPKPVLGLVQGAAYGGGVGLAACCDIVIACDKASFSLSEVKLGLIPAVISPYVVRAIGARACRRYFLTAERFSAAEAHRLGLVHDVVPADGLEAARDGMLAALSLGGPAAQGAAKDLIQMVGEAGAGPALMSETARRIAEIRASAEGREGLSAFLEKRKPEWVREG